MSGVVTHPRRSVGFVALGTPLGHPRFVAAHTDIWLVDEVRLLQELPLLPDLQCAWLLLAMCASPRADHFLRTLPPSLSASYARGHDDGWVKKMMLIPRSLQHAV